MLHVTPRATTELRSLLKDGRATVDEVLRFALNGRGGLTMMVGTPGADDVGAQDAGRPVLIIAARLAARLAGHVLDVTEVTVDDRVTLAFTPRLPSDEEHARWDAVTPAPLPWGQQATWWGRTRRRATCS
jgi:hypothetical protein